jgi:hypothetical protein
LGKSHDSRNRVISRVAVDGELARLLQQFLSVVFG